MMPIAQMVRGVLWVHFQGRTFIYEDPAEKNFSRGQSSGTKSGDLVSPMPGKIIKVLKSLGDPVNVGDVVLVMEAMKMEYSLKSEVTGEVTMIKCQVGDQVALGKTLVQVKEKAGA